MAFQPKTPEQVKQDFFLRGETVNAWALKNKFNPTEVYRVLNGQNKATKGNGHRIAVALGMKPQPDATAAKHTTALINLA